MKQMRGKKAIAMLLVATMISSLPQKLRIKYCLLIDKNNIKG